MTSKIARKSLIKSTISRLSFGTTLGEQGPLDRGYLSASSIYPGGATNLRKELGLWMPPANVQM